MLKMEVAFSTSLSSSAARLKTRMCAMTLGERLKSVRDLMPQDDLSKFLDVHKNTLANYEKGSRIPDADFLNKFLAMFPEIDPGWLLTGEGVKLRDEEYEKGGALKGELKQTGSDISEAAPGYGFIGHRDLRPDRRTNRRTDDKYCYIPLYNVSASAGGGSVVDEENVLDFLSFKADWIRVQLFASPDDLYLIHVEGESMEPTLRPGDVILVNHREASSLPRDGIYVMRMDGTLLVKRLQRMPGGVVKVTSDNTAYEPFVVNLGQASDEVNIVGRVVWCGRRM